MFLSRFFINCKPLWLQHFIFWSRFSPVLYDFCTRGWSKKKLCAWYQNYTYKNIYFSKFTLLSSTFRNFYRNFPKLFNVPIWRIWNILLFGLPKFYADRHTEKLCIAIYVLSYNDYSSKYYESRENRGAMVIIIPSGL